MFLHRILTLLRELRAKLQREVVRQIRPNHDLQQLSRLEFVEATRERHAIARSSIKKAIGRVAPRSATFSFIPHFVDVIARRRNLGRDPGDEPQQYD